VLNLFQKTAHLCLNYTFGTIPVNSRHYQSHLVALVLCGQRVTFRYLVRIVDSNKNLF